MDQDGFVFVLDRLKDMIISGGENVYCAEVENAILSHEAVLECAVIGAPDDLLGERVHAVVVLHPRQEMTLAQLSSHCATDRGLQVPAARWVRPRGPKVMGELPPEPCIRGGST